MISIDTRKFFNRMKKFNISIKKKWNKVLYIYKNQMVARAKDVHVYKNRTGTLTKNTNGFVKNLTITLENKTEYAKYVRDSTNNNWLRNAATYYKRDLEKDLRRVK